jgi:predicted GNAT family acetyltransferase
VPWAGGGAEVGEDGDVVRRVVGADVVDTQQDFTLRNARWSDSYALTRWLLRDPETYLFALSWIERYGVVPHRSGDFAFWLATEGEGQGVAPRILGACLLMARRTALPMSARMDVVRAFGYRASLQQLHLEHVTGPREAANTFWQVYGGAARARLVRAQGLYTLHDEPPTPPGAPEVPLRVAQMEDLEAVVVASAAMYREETLSDPYRDDPRSFRAMHQRRLMERRTWVWTQDSGDVLFKAEVSCASSYGAQIAGVYTAPEARGQGVARRGLGLLCQKLLVRYPRVTLYVNDENKPALRLYQRLGFLRWAPYGSIFIT